MAACSLVSLCLAFFVPININQNEKNGSLLAALQNNHLQSSTLDS